MGFDNQMEQNLGLYAYMYTSPFFFSKAVLLQIFCFLVLFCYYQEMTDVY